MKTSFLMSAAFWASTAERTIKTFAQSLLALFLGDSALSVISVDWTSGLAVAGTAALVSVLTSIASGTVGPDNSPSLVGEPPVVVDDNEGAGK